MTTLPGALSAPPPLADAERRRAEALPAAILLVALSALAPLSVDMFLPSLPTMNEEFGAAPSTMQLAVLLFILAFASSQLVYGPLSDRAGRRPALFAGLTLFIAGGFVALFATNPTMLIVGRVIQGLGGGAGPALAQAMVLDVYGRDRAARVLAYMSIALPLAPAIAPIIGGFLHDASGWHSVFLTLIALGAVLLIMYNLLLPETNTVARRAARARTGVLADYRTALSSPTFMAYALVMGLMFGGQLLFISTSAFVLIEELGLRPSVYGFSFAFVAAGIMTGASLSSRLVVRLQPRRTVLLGASVSFVASAVMAAVAWLFTPSLQGVLGPMFFVAVGLGITRPSAMAAAVIEFPQMAGLASGALGFAQMLVASTLNIVYGRLFEPSSIALASGVCVAMFAGLATVLILRPGRSGEARTAPSSTPASETAPAPFAAPPSPAPQGDAAAPLQTGAPEVESTAAAEATAESPLEARAPEPEDAVTARLEAIQLSSAPAHAPATSSPTSNVTSSATAPVLAAGYARRAIVRTEAPRTRPRDDVPLDEPAAEGDSKDGADSARAEPLTRPAATLLLLTVTMLLGFRLLVRFGGTRRIARD